ncbi:hypothetical protein BASA81_011090 [Batrachochytrium salamandrivorans]|nr:hypothetical protein BASA81_011090 [Batrachochytrium salamandrivorans]
MDNTALLEEGEEREEEQPRRNCFKYVGCLVLGVVLLVLISASIYLVNHGAFSKVRRDVRIVNGSVVEPNTKLVFPLHREVSLQNLPGPERLVGLFLKTKYVPEIHATMRVFALALYVDRTEGRQGLAQYERDGCPNPKTSPAKFASFYQLLGAGKVTVTLEYRMVMSPPGGRMFDRWLADLIDLWLGYGANGARMAALEKCFTGWFKKVSFKNGDDDLIQVTSKSKVTYAKHNGQLLEPCKDAWFGRAIIEHEFLENGNLLCDLLPTLWNKEYDQDGEEDLTVGKERLRQRLNKIELINKQFNAYAEKLNALSRQQEEDDGVGDEDDDGAYYEEEYADQMLPEDENDEEFSVGSREYQHAVQSQPLPHPRWEPKFSRPAPPSSAALYGWEVREKELLRELASEKRRTNRAEILFKQAEKRAQTLEHKLREATGKIQALQAQMERAPKPVAPVAEFATKREVAKRLLAEAPPLQAEFRAMAKKTSSSRPPPFVPGGNSIVSQNRLVPIRAVSKRDQLQERKAQLEQEYRNLFRSGGQYTETELNYILGEIREVNRRLSG